MSIRSKIITWLTVVILALILVPLWITNFLLNREAPETQPELKEPITNLFGDLKSTTYELDEGYSFDLISTWNLVSNEPARAVDRYRFERAGTKKATFTISFYEEIESFEDVIQARYGDGFVSEAEAIEVNGMEAQRVTSAFLDQGDSADVIVKIGEDEYISLYSIHMPEGEGSSRITTEINQMQMSFVKNVDEQL